MLATPTNLHVHCVAYFADSNLVCTVFTSLVLKFCSHFSTVVAPHSWFCFLCIHESQPQSTACMNHHLIFVLCINCCVYCGLVFIDTLVRVSLIPSCTLTPTAWIACSPHWRGTSRNLLNIPIVYTQGACKRSQVYLSCVNMGGDLRWG